MLSPILRTYVNPDADDSVLLLASLMSVLRAKRYTKEIGVLPTPDQLHDLLNMGIGQ